MSSHTLCVCNKEKPFVGKFFFKKINFIFKFERNMEEIFFNT